METKLERISQLSREKPDMVFTSIGHLINKDLLKECHKVMDGKKAVGIDGITKEEYGANLEQNLDTLSKRLKQTERPAHLAFIVTRISWYRRRYVECWKQSSSHISMTK